MPGVCFLCVVVCVCVSSLGFREVHEDPVALRKRKKKLPSLYADQDLKPCCSWVRRCFILLTFVADLGCMILILVPILPPLLCSAKDVPRCVLLNWFVKLRFLASFNETPSHCQKRCDWSLPGSERVSHRSMSTVWACPSPLLISPTQCPPAPHSHYVSFSFLPWNPPFFAFLGRVGNVL